VTERASQREREREIINVIALSVYYVYLDRKKLRNIILLLLLLLLLLLQK
jgi:hypothetical protein